MTTPDAVAIFGATSDIAAAVARLYAEAGRSLVLIGRDGAAMEAAAADLRTRGAPGVAVLTADLAQTAALPGLADAAWKAFGGLGVALIAYGSLPGQAEVQADPAAAEAALRLNFVSPAVLAGALAELFAQQGGGTLAAITSVAGDRGRGSNYVYGSAKGGLQRFLEGLRHRLHRHGVAVVDIRPGFVQTKMTAHLGGTGPLWASPGAVAADVVRAIAKRRAVAYTPWFWRGIMAGVRAAPRPLFHRTGL